MKFFMRVGFQYGEGEDHYSHVGVIYGPYADDEAVDKALSRLYPNDKTEQFLVFEGRVTMVKPSTKEKPEHEKRDPGNLENYIKDGKGGYQCKDCGATIVTATVAHPIHLREMPGAGSGQCQNEQVPYCPNCERKPNFHGTPVYEAL